MEIADSPMGMRQRKYRETYRSRLSGWYNGYYHALPFLIDDAALRNARLALAQASAQVLRNGLALLGVSAPEKM